MSDNTLKNSSLHLAVPETFSLKATALSHGWHECSPMSWNECGGCLQWITRGEERPFRVSISEPARREDRIAYLKSQNSNRKIQSRGATSRHLSIRIDGRVGEAAHGQIDGDVDGAGRERVLADAHRILGLDEELSEFYELCAEHPRLAIVPKIGAGRLIKSPTMTENIIKCLCATNINWTQAVKAINRIAQLGPHVRHFRNLTAWPTPREIARAGEKYLVEVCRMGYRAEPIVKLCRDVDSGKFDPESLWSLAADLNISSDELLKILTSIRGIGPASAHSLLGLLGRHDRVSIDSATIAHVAAIHTNGRKPTLKKIQRIYAPYGKWKNLVYWCESWIRWETAGELIREFQDANGGMKA